MADALNDLIARLEVAQGPDRELDRGIYKITGIRIIPLRVALGGRMDASPEWEGGASSNAKYIPFFTDSLDAAMTLVPEGWDWTLTSGGVAFICSDWDEDRAPSFSSLPNDRKREPGKFPPKVDGLKTPAIALCIAALKARAAQTSSGSGGK